MLPMRETDTWHYFQTLLIVRHSSRPMVVSGGHRPPAPPPVHTTAHNATFVWFVGVMLVAANVALSLNIKQRWGACFQLHIYSFFPCCSLLIFSFNLPIEVPLDNGYNLTAGKVCETLLGNRWSQKSAEQKNLMSFFHRRWRRRIEKKEREHKTKPKLTQYGQYAEQDRYQGVNAHSHPPSSGFAPRRNPPGITLTRLQQAAAQTMSQSGR